MAPGKNISKGGAVWPTSCNGFPNLLSGVRKRVVSKRVALAEVPGTKHRKDGTFRCSPVPTKGRGYIRMFPCTKTGTRAHLPKPPCYDTAPFVSSRYSDKTVFLWNCSVTCGRPNGHITPKGHARLRCLESQFAVRNDSSCHWFAAIWNRTIRIARPKTVQTAVKALLFHF